MLCCIYIYIGTHRIYNLVVVWCSVMPLSTIKYVIRTCERELCHPIVEESVGPRKVCIDDDDDHSFTQLLTLKICRSGGVPTGIDNTVSKAKKGVVIG